MKSTLFLIGLLATTVLFISCQTKNDPQQVDCQPPTTLIAKAPCESGYPGAQLVASNFKGGSANQFVYSIFVQKDTLSSDISKSSYANASNEQIIISETILKDAPKFIVKVTINCGTGKEYSSIYFSFVKRPAANQGCYVWANQTQ